MKKGIFLVLICVFVSACGDNPDENSEKQNKQTEESANRKDEAVCTKPPAGEALDREGCLRAGELAAEFDTFIGVDEEVGEVCCFFSTK